MKVSEIMAKNPVTVSMNDSLERVKSLFETTGLHHVCVLERDVLVGVVSDRDVLRNLTPFIGKLPDVTQDAPTLRKKVHQIMTRKPVTVNPDTTVVEATEALMKYRVSCLPVVAPDRALQGIVTSNDLLRHLLTKESS